MNQNTRRSLTDILDDAKKKERDDPYSNTNYQDLLPKDTEYSMTLSQSHQKKYSDGVELRVVSTYRSDGLTVDVLVSENNPTTGWKDIAYKHFPTNSFEDNQYIVKMFYMYEAMHGRAILPEENGAEEIYDLGEIDDDDDR